MMNNAMTVVGGTNNGTESLAAQMRKLTTEEREWVKALAENKSVSYEEAIPYVLGYRANRPEVVLAK